MNIILLLSHYIHKPKCLCLYLQKKIILKTLMLSRYCRLHQMYVTRLIIMLSSLYNSVSRLKLLLTGFRRKFMLSMFLY